MQDLKKGVRGGGQVAVVPPNQAKVTFRLDIGDGQGSQDALLNFEGDGKVVLTGPTTRKRDRKQ
jgi:hypothetical protein